MAALWETQPGNFNKLFGKATELGPPFENVPSWIKHCGFLSQMEGETQLSSTFRTWQMGPTLNSSFWAQRCGSMVKYTPCTHEATDMVLGIAKKVRWAGGRERQRKEERRGGWPTSKTQIRWHSGMKIAHQPNFSNQTQNRDQRNLESHFSMESLALKLKV